jgi:hypothetical protein
MKKSLTDIIYKYKGKEFCWGQLDCCIFTASVVEEFTGRSLPFWRDVLHYNDYKKAMIVLKNLGCESVLDLPSIILSTPKKDISEVKLGEPVYYIDNKGRGLLGICNGAQAYFVTEGGTLTTRPINACDYCWSID